MGAYITAMEKGMGKDACQSAELEECISWLNAEAEKIAGGDSSVPSQEAGDGQVPEEFQRVRQTNFDMALSNLDGDVSCEGETWAFTKGQDGVKVFSAAVPGQTIKRWRVEMCLHNATPAQIDYLLMDGEARLQWSPGLSEMRTLKTFDDGTFVSMFRSLPVAGGMISAREFVEVRFRQTKEDGTIFNWAEGLLNTPLQPVSDGLVRAYAMKGSGYRLVPRGTSVDFTMTFMTDIGGQIPIWILNSSMAASSIQEMNALRGAVQSGLGKDAKMPKCVGADGVVSGDDGNTASKPGPGSDAQPQPCPTKHSRTLADAKDQYFANLSNTTSDGESWAVEKDTDNIKVLSARIPDQKIKRWKVIGEVECGSPEVLWRLIGEYEYRLKWDTALRMGRNIALHENGIETVYYQVNEAAGGWISPRDFVDIRQTRAYTDNGRAAIETWCCSLDPNEGARLQAVEGSYVRGENLAGGGFKVITTSDTTCEITMLAVTDIKGSLPVSIINSAMSSTFVSMVQGMRTCLAKKTVEPPSTPLEFLSGSETTGASSRGREQALAHSLSSPSSKKSNSIFHSGANPSTLDNILKKHGLSSMSTDDFPLLVAAKSTTDDDKAMACVRELLLTGASVCQRSEKGETALHAAAATDHVGAMRLLLQAPKATLSVDLTNDDGDTPLHIAAQHGSTACAQMLLESGASDNHKNYAGRTAVVNAVFFGNYQTSQAMAAHMGDQRSELILCVTVVPNNAQAAPRQN
jgi:hypothetical protein